MLQRRLAYAYAEIDFSTSGLQYGSVDNALSSYYYMEQPTGTPSVDNERMFSSGSSYPLQVGSIFNGFGGVMMEFGLMNSSSFTDENNLKSYLATKWGTGGCPAIDSIENGHGVVGSSSIDYYCRIPFESRACSQSCASG